MLNFLSTFTNTNLAAFPDTEAVNSSGGAATDGTEFIAAMVNDSLWGWQQALLSSVGLTPNGITEAVGASQILDALRKFTIPGMIIPVCWNDDPATLKIRAIQLTGQGVLRSNYEELDAVAYVGDADNAAADSYYHADDAAGTIRNTIGAYLILPDGRGRVVRGRDLSGSVDPDGVSSYLGSEQEDAAQRITGDIFAVDVGGAVQGVFTGVAGGVQRGAGGGASTTINFDNNTSLLPNPAKTTEDQTRVKSLLFDYAITY